MDTASNTTLISKGRNLSDYARREEGAGEGGGVSWKQRPSGSLAKYGLASPGSRLQQWPHQESVTLSVSVFSRRALVSNILLLQHHSSKASILQHSTFFIVQLSHPYMTTVKTIALTRQTFVGKVMSLLF